MLVGRKTTTNKHVGLQVGGGAYLQARGVSQGSVLSPLLCAFYYGRMEAHLLPVPGPDEMLLRQVDDFLLVTPHLHRATAFLTTMLAGTAPHCGSLGIGVVVGGGGVGVVIVVVVVVVAVVVVVVVVLVVVVVIVVVAEVVVVVVVVVAAAAAISPPPFHVRKL